MSTVLTPTTLIKLGIISSGFATGYSFATTHLSIQTLLQTPGLTPTQLCAAFDKIFNRGATIFVPLVGISSTSFLGAAYLLRDSLSTTALGLTRPAQLGSAALAILSTLAWTRIRMYPGINRLMSGDVNRGIMLVRDDLEDWGWTNRIRGGLVAIGLILGITAL